MPAETEPSSTLDLAVLGAGYAGLRLAREVARRSRGKVRPTLIDRHPVHTLRTELYEIDKLADARSPSARWLVPLAEALDHQTIGFRQGEVEAIDLAGSHLVVSGSILRYRQLAICLGSVPAYFGVPGADHAHQVYGFYGARQFAVELRERLKTTAEDRSAPPVRVAIVGGGSTGTEVSAEIATAPWGRIAARGARRPQVTLITGSLPFLEGMPEPIVRHARRLLARAKVTLVEHLNVSRVESDHLVLENGERHAFDLVVWCAGVQAPNVVRTLPVPHGRGGRIRVDAHLEVAGYPGVFVIGDSAEFHDERTGMIAPATAQAALAEAPMAAANLLSRRANRPLRPFEYRERGVVVAVGLGRAAGRAAGLTVWGSPAALLKAAVDRGYAFAARHRRTPRGL